ncbi:MAG: hypothetical protein U0R69_01085 [Gaiellales bacterium]
MPGLQRSEAGAAPHEVLLGVPRNHIIATATVQGVSTRATSEIVITSIAVHGIRATSTAHGRYRHRQTAHQRPSRRSSCHHQPTLDRISTTATVEGVVAGITTKRIRRP